MSDLRKQHGYPKEWSVPSRNRANANQPGALMDPTPTMLTEKARGLATALSNWEPKVWDGYAPEQDMDYSDANQPDVDSTLSTFGYNPD